MRPLNKPQTKFTNVCLEASHIFPTHNLTAVSVPKPKPFFFMLAAFEKILRNTDSEITLIKTMFVNYF